MQELASSGAALRARAIYDYGETAIIASSIDPRFHMMLYVPPAAAEGKKVDLLVAVHGTGRTSAFEFRDGFAEFGLYNDCAILCPIFPVNVRGDGARSGYKYMQEGDIRYDKVLLSMVEEMAGKYGQDWSKFAIFGYSGGGHFAHRFTILHPEKLWAASIGAPGSVTLLDPDRDWWVGVRDVAERFGKPFAASASHASRFTWLSVTQISKPGRSPMHPARPISWKAPMTPVPPDPSGCAVSRLPSRRPG